MPLPLPPKKSNALANGKAARIDTFNTTGNVLCYSQQWRPRQQWLPQWEQNRSFVFAHGEPQRTAIANIKSKIDISSIEYTQTHTLTHKHTIAQTYILKAYKKIKKREASATERSEPAEKKETTTIDRDLNEK